ncbi:hypothetical protein F5X98DRAFT_381049 [Xylaria grammica]|nr:hypothetical protein F5X98DRAFT_381049 [Xylaria grammica]
MTIRRFAFIFRIGPRVEPPMSPPDEVALVEEVTSNGLMEFVLVPWENGCDSYHHEYGQLTVNLALWLTHILAGNNHRLCWQYNRLCEERVAERVDGEDVSTWSLESQTWHREKTTADKEAQACRGQTSGQETLDLPIVSFSGNPIPQPNTSFDSYAEGSDDQSGTSVSEDLDSLPRKRRLISAFSSAHAEQRRSPTSLSSLSALGREITFIVSRHSNRRISLMPGTEQGVLA